MYLTINQSVREVQQADLAADILTHEHSRASTCIILCGRILMYCTSLLRLPASRLIRFHILVWLWTWILSFSCRLFLILHFDVVSRIGFRRFTSLAVGLLLILLSLALLAFLLLFLLWLRGWRIQDCEDFRSQRVDLVFYLFDGVR